MNSIYLYKNKINGHMYVGMAKDAERRYKEHKNASFNKKHRQYNYPIHAAIRKYGLKNFDFIILEDNLLNIKQMKQREIYWISYYNTYKNKQHYNQTPGGDLPSSKTIHLGQQHGMAKLTKKDVIFCRNSYKKGLKSRDIWNQYFSNKITYSGFERMWHGKTWKHTMPEVFQINPHKAKYGSKDRDYLVQKFKESGLSLNGFSKTKECYVGYGTLYKMVHNPSFYDGK